MLPDLPSTIPSVSAAVCQDGLDTGQSWLDEKIGDLQDLRV